MREISFKKNKIMKRWSIPFAGFLLALMGGISYAWGVFVIPMTETFGWSSAQSSLPLTVFMVIFSLTMVPAGRWQDTFGPKKIAKIGAFLFLLAYGLSALVNYFPSPWWLVMTYGFIGGIACGLTYSCVAPPARKWFPDKPALAISLGVMGFGLAAVLIAPLKANYLIPQYGIDGTFLILALLSSTVSFVAACMIKNPPKEWSLVGYKNKTSIPSLGQKPNLNPKEVISTTLFKIIWLAFAFVIVGGMVAIGLIPAYAENILSATPIQAALAIAIFAGFNGFGRPFAGLLSDKYGVVWVMLFTYIIQALTFLLFPLFVTSLSALYIGAALLGWGYAVTLALFPQLTALSFGLKNMGMNYGLVFTAFGVGAFAPLLGSLVYDITNSYTSVFVCAGIMTSFGLILCGILKHKYTIK